MSVKGNGYAVISREDPNNEKKNPGHLSWEDFFYFSPKFPILRSQCLQKPNSMLVGLGFQSQIFVQAMSTLLHGNEFMSTNECA